MKHFAPLIVAGLLCVTALPAAAACNVQVERAAANKLYAEKGASLKGERADAVAAAMEAAGRNHEVGKNKEACEGFATVRALLQQAPDAAATPAAPVPTPAQAPAPAK